MGKHKKRKHKSSRHRYAHAARPPGPGCSTSYNEPCDSVTMVTVKNLFNKVYTYPCDIKAHDISSPEIHQHLFDGRRWTTENLRELREELNSTKEKLSQFDITHWHNHTSQTHPGGFILNHIRRKIGAELATQAWFKFWEILQRFELAPPGDGHGVFTSVHLCEAPGAFIASLNHLLKNKAYKGQWWWTALTLNPYYEGNAPGQMIADDTLIYNTPDQWYFGQDDTGDIMIRENVQGLIERTRIQGDMYLVTADGSIDCANNPAKQEAITCSIHYAEVVAALHVLTPGGNFVLKMFTMFEDSSICLMYLLYCAFEKVNVFKPVTSKPGNSEVYVVCQSYRRASQALLDKLLHQLGPSVLQSDAVLFSESFIPQEFHRAHFECCQKFSHWQIQTITTNLQMFEDRHIVEDVYGATKQLKKCCLSEFLEKYPVQPIGNGQQLVAVSAEVRDVRKGTHMRNRHFGSYNDRQQQLQLVWEDRVHQMTLLAEEPTFDISWLPRAIDIDPKEVIRWRPTRGKTIERVYSSKFCDNNILCLYNEMLHKAKCLETAYTEDAYVTFLQRIAKQLMQDIFVDCDQTDVIGDENDLLTRALCSSQTDNKTDLVRRKTICVDSYCVAFTETEWCCQGGHIFENVIQAFETFPITEGDTLVMTAPPMLTRLHAGLILFLNQCFKMVTVRIYDASFPICLVVAVGYQTPQDDIATYFYGIMDDLRRISSEQITTATKVDTEAGNMECESRFISRRQEVMAIVPIQLLHDRDLQNLLWKANNHFIHKRLNCLIKQEKNIWQTSS